MKRRHNLKRRNVLGFGPLITFALTLGLAPLPAQAQDKYPERPIRLVIPFAPGGNTDIVGRLYGNKMTPLLGQSVVIDNKGGAGGTIGSAEVARAKADGYTLLFGTSSTHAINPLIMESVAYDPVKDFAPIAVIGITPMAIAVHPTVAKSLQELIKRVRANPGKFSYGSCGTGSICHVTGELFKKEAGGLDIVHVPYRSSGQSVMDLVAGQIPIVAGTFSSMVTYHRAGKVRILAVFSEKRSDVEPSISTAIELGVPGMVAATFNVLLAPAGTPKAVIDRLYGATRKVVSETAFQKDLDRLTVEPVTDSNPEKAARFIKSELAKWAPIIKASGIKVQ